MKYFGTDGIRGIAYEKLNSMLAFRLGQAISFVFKPKEVVIGMDTRESSPMLAYALSNGLMSRGVDVLFAGVCSTPMIANYSLQKNIIGVMITASHNPYMDNGIKVFNKGYKTTELDEEKLEDFLDHGEITYQTFGQLIHSNDIELEYLKIYSKFSVHPSNFKIGYDSANGANHLIAKKLFDMYAPDAIQISNEPNGKNINLDCGSTHLESIINLVRDQKLDIGFSFDGDGDRIMVVDSNLKVYDGDMLIYIIASYLKKKHLLNQNTVVLTKMSNPGILKALKDQEIHFSLTNVGDKYVFEELFRHDYTIGGEASGHIILRHLLHSGDGLLVAIYLLQILEELKTSLEELTKDIVLYPLKLTNIKGISKSVLESSLVSDMISHVKILLGENALLLVRPSGTEDLIRITISHQDMLLVDETTQMLVDIINKEGIKR
jgi:phosphoglucosamine mutase